MTQKKWITTLASVLLFAIAALALQGEVRAQSPNRVFEMRTYYTHEGKLEDLLNRFRNHTTKYFEKHGMTNIGYWVPRDQPNTLVYVLAYPSREAATAAWDAFRKDEGWIAVSKASVANGPIVAKVVSVFMDPTNFSALK